MNGQNSDDKNKQPKVLAPNLKERATSVGYERGRPSHSGQSSDGPMQQQQSSYAQQTSNLDFSGPDEATRMSQVELEASTREGIVIASSSIHKVDINALRPKDEAVSIQADPSGTSIRQQERGRGRLIITYLNTKEIHYTDNGTTRIGRDAENELRLIDPKASRQHARIEVSAIGYRIIDLGAGNGIRVNGRKKRSIELFHGDVIQIGDTTLVFETIGWVRDRTHQTVEAGVFGWARFLTLLDKKDRFRLSIYSLSLSFLASGFIFLLMSFLSTTGAPTTEQHVLSFRRQAEKRAMNGDLAGALRSLDKVAFMTDSLTDTDLRKQKRWQRQMREAGIYRDIQIRALGDPTPEELDGLMEQLEFSPSIRAAAASQIARAKLSYLDRTIQGQDLSEVEETRLRRIYNSIERKLVNTETYMNVSRRLFRK